MDFYAFPHLPALTLTLVYSSRLAMLLLLLLLLLSVQFMHVSSLKMCRYFMTAACRVLGGEDSVTMTRMPYLVERAMVTVLRACIHMFDREDMGVSVSMSMRLTNDFVSAPLT